MDNKAIAKLFKLCSQLMELYDENPFRVKGIASASFKLEKLPSAIANMTFEELSAQPGIGKSTAEKVQQIMLTGTFPELTELLEKTPIGIQEMMKIKGLGPKKIKIIWQDLDIESVGELYYACNENRLKDAKGFGYKTQEDIKKAIEFATASEGWFLYARALPSANALLEFLTKQLPAGTQISFAGDFRRKVEVLQQIELIADVSRDALENALVQLKYEMELEETKNSISFKDENNFSFQVYPSEPHSFGTDLLFRTGSEAHIEQLQKIQNPIPNFPTEKECYAYLGLDYIEPELREGFDELGLAKEHKLPELIRFDDLKGSLHNHSTYSDGVHTLSEMANYCKNELKLQYFGICDHSKTAVYANGLSSERVQQQWTEIDQLNQQLAPFKILKGIESDILSDGSLDYPDELLSQFDFVVGSVHSNLKMDEEKATARLIKAIENPYTTILGHPTGRLLLSRAGYPIDYKKVIDACAENNVVIEINANPLRLDMDWRWHRYAVSKGVLFSINPDAHRTEGLWDMHFGIEVARKGGLTKENCLNAMSLSEIEAYLKK
ncbi:DNA polymerase/3'-5' exonuclease PolX [Sphingobacterium hungaricum]|uniref:DNA-directed DNA polymerase n=1 Tax=Sphingobacterium hungaricum TaxID=2082723 RepID=A0A928V120_9SPHI|nr:DNA polymerase/3'-5' exonuclease PolX [Sphingobacterium hungaricum]MBE8714542.1 DNA polymerase/3'-5' exonuclease PolX [Sphingobacterium hungaricum]